MGSVLHDVEDYPMYSGNVMLSQESIGITWHCLSHLQLFKTQLSSWTVYESQCLFISAIEIGGNFNSTHG